MKRISSLIVAVAMASMIYSQCDVDGNYRVTALDVQYYDIARQSVDVEVSDAYGILPDPVVLTTINAGDLFYSTHSGPYNSAVISQVGINLNVSFSDEDCTASLAAGSFYPDVNEENCISSVQILPITDQMTYSSNQGADGVSPLPSTNMIGIPSISRRANDGNYYGGLSLDEALIFDYFPQGGTGYAYQYGTDFIPDFCVDLGAGLPAGCPGANQSNGLNPVYVPMDINATADGQYPGWNHQVALPGIHGGWIKISDNLGASEICDPGPDGDCGTADDVLPPNAENPDGYAEWHAIDGAASESGLGDFIGQDEDGFDGDFDRTFGLPVIPTVTYFNDDASCLHYATLGDQGVAGDVTAAVQGGVQAGCYAQVETAVVASCNGAGSPFNWSFGVCAAEANGDTFAAGCAAGGVAIAIQTACEDAGGPTESDPDVANGLTCADLGTSYAAACADDADPCACAVAAATSTDAASLCSLGATIATTGWETATCAEFVGSFQDSTLDELGLASGALSYDCATTAAGWAATCISGVDVGSSVYVMNPDPLYAQWGQFVTGNAVAFGATVDAYVAALDDLNQNGYPDEVEACMGAGGSADDCAAATAAAAVAAVAADGGTGTYLWTTNDSGYDADPTNPTAGGRWTFNFTPTCIPEIEVRQVVIEFNELGNECVAPGDSNGDGSVDILDVVDTVGFILGNDTINNELCADHNGDGTVDILDVVDTVNAILGNSRVLSSATSIEINKFANEVTFDADGYVGAIQMTLSHGDDFAIELNDNALVADYNTDENKTVVIVVRPESADLFTTEGAFTIEEVLASSDGSSYMNVEMNVPVAYTISNAYPNPFNPSTAIDIALDNDANVSVKVFNVMGQLVDVVSSGNLNPGSHSVVWDASQVASGVYFINTEVGSEVNVQKVMLVK